MKINKYITIVLFALCSLLVPLYANASTTDAAVQAMARQAAIAQNGTNFDAPFIIPDSGIDSTNGAVNLFINDLTLPGKNGLDVVINRRHNTFDPDYTFYHESSISRYQESLGVPYDLYIDGEYDDTYFVSYEYETDIIETGYITETEYGNIKRDERDKLYYPSDWLDDEKTDYKLKWNKNVEPHYLVEEERHGFTRITTNNFSLGYGWDIIVPNTTQYWELYVDHGDYDNCKQYANIQFEDGKKETLKYEFEDYKKITEEVPTGYVLTDVQLLNERTNYTLDMSLEPITDERGFVYNLKVTNDEGKSYYFYFENPTNSADSKITAITDRYDNLILYDVTDDAVYITDTYGREITVTSSGITVNAGDMTKRIDYTKEIMLDSQKDPNGYYPTLHKYNFKVSKYSDEDGSGEVEETLYGMKQELFRAVYRIAHEDLNHYKIDYIEYPTDSKREYIYEETPQGPMYFINYSSYYFDEFLRNHRVIGEKVYENGTLKTDKTFSYEGTWGKTDTIDWVDLKSFVTTETLPNGHEKETVMDYDSFDRVTRAEISYRDQGGHITKQSTKYTYATPISYHGKSSIGEYERKVLRKAEVINISTYENGDLISSEDVDYKNNSTKLTKQKIGETQTLHTYDSTYLVPKSTTTKQLNKGDLRQVNTLTSDKKNIAKTHIYEGSTLLRTINYTYNTDGTLKSQSETNASGTVLTEYAYNYATDSSYTVTTTVRNVTDNDGNSKNVSTVTGYDSLGRMISQRDANGYFTRYEYDMLGRMTTQINPDNTTQTITYDTDENNLSFKDENNYVTTYDYSPTGNLEKVYLDTDSSKVLTEYTYDALDRKTSETVYQDIGGTGTSNVYTYDDFNRVSTVTTKHGDTVLDVATNTYERYDNCISSRDGDDPIDVSNYDKVEIIIHNVTVGNDYDTARVLVELDGETVINELYDYYARASFVLDVSDAQELSFDEENGGYSVTIRPFTKGDITLCGGASQTVTTTYQGDENFVNPTKVAVMDGYGNVVSESYYDGEVTEDNLLNKNIYEYDYQGNVIKTLGGRTYMENLGDYTTKTEYDYMGNPTKEYRADGSYITNTYDKMGNLTATTDYMGNTTTYAYDALSRVIKTTAPFEGDKTSETLTYYDNCGNVIKTKQQNNYLYGSATYRTTEHRYDNRNRHTITIANDGTQDIYTQYAYDGVGNVTQMITGQTERIYDMNGTLPSGATREIYEYDRFGNVIKTTDNEGRIATAEYNLIGKPLVETDKNGETKYTLYNPYGSPAMVEKGDFIQMFEYTANNLLLSVGTSKERLSNITYTYDKLGRVAREHKTGNLQGTPISDYTYDVNGNRKSYTLTYRGSQVYSANYAYDNLDRLTTVSYNDMDVSDISYTYDTNNRVLSESTTDNTATYTYNSAGLVTNLVNSNGADFRYIYNVDGNQYQMQSDRGEWILYEYDGLGQLISEDGMSEYVSHYKTYTYDTRGNRISSESEDLKGQFTVSEYTYDSTNRLLTRKDTVGTAETNTRYEYDNNGNLILKHKEILTDAATSGDEEIALYPPTADGDLTDDLVTTYTYNDFDELSGIETEDNSVSYLYDATGKRSLEIKNGNYGIMIWDGDYVVAETVKNTTVDASKPIANTYFRGHKLFANKSTNGVGYYTYDAHGSVIGMSGEKYVYDAFGNQITDTTAYNPFRYCGEYMEPDTGLIYLRNRYYDPSIGRFITEDPIKDGLNWYVYCGNNPVMFVDPLGLEYLVVSGSEYDEGRWKYNFVEPAIKKINELKDLGDGESITWIVSATDYSETALSEMGSIAEELGVSFITINSAAELQNYINSKDISKWEVTENRLNDKIKKFTVFSHGLKGRVSLGYNQLNSSELELNYSWIEGISSVAFDNPNSAFYSCNTGTNVTDEWGDNFAQKWVNVTGGRTWAARGKTDYNYIMNDIISHKWSRGSLFSHKGSDNYPVASSGVSWMNFYK